MKQSMTEAAAKLGMPSSAGFFDGEDGLIHIGSKVFVGESWCESMEIPDGSGFMDGVELVGAHFGDLDVDDAGDLCITCKAAALEEE